jgi:hypothetical protein
MLQIEGGDNRGGEEREDKRSSDKSRLQICLWRFAVFVEIETGNMTLPEKIDCCSKYLQTMLLEDCICYCLRKNDLRCCLNVLG